MNQPRIQLLDLLRGIALLGILLMNIRLFSAPEAAYFSPLVYGEQLQLNKIWWTLQYFIADQKFMAIFSMLFGASTALICDRLDAKGLCAWRIYTRRLLVLLLIGLLHAYLIWHGDILVFYALCGVIPFVFRHLNWRICIMFGLLCLGVGSLKSYLTYLSMVSLPAAIQQQIITQSLPGMIQVSETEIAALNGSWAQQLSYRISAAWHFHTDVLPNWGIWRVSGMMLLGLGLYRCGFLRGQFSILFYQQTAWTGIISGMLLSLYGYYLNEQTAWQFPHYFFGHTLFNYWGAVCTAVGLIALITLWQASGCCQPLARFIQGIGRTALSNYLLQSILCTAFFYGVWGFARMPPYLTALVVVIVWLLQFLLTHWWLQTHAKGPVEALWHLATYAKVPGLTEKKPQTR
ncbi:DUF418 domain-containing protein [Bowmanella denitrificans]|uniref:DUF418 domain-containing protein n=1 Tax=Bowmanella denitrificans TaxID=366582 RepID=A0ABP3GE93_9ALTE